jgi:hypothetical protein
VVGKEPQSVCVLAGDSLADRPKQAESVGSQVPMAMAVRWVVAPPT